MDLQPIGHRRYLEYRKELEKSNIHNTLNHGEMEFSELLKKYHEEEVLGMIDNVPIKIKDLATLEKGQEINFTIIETMYHIFEKSAPIMEQTFMALHNDKRILKNNISKVKMKDRTFIPINLKVGMNNHWTLLTLHKVKTIVRNETQIKTQRMLYYDSLSVSIPKQVHDFVKIYKEVTGIEADLEIVEGLKQHDKVNCGVYVILELEKQIYNLPTSFSLKSTSITDCRTRILSRIRTHSLCKQKIEIDHDQDDDEIEIIEHQKDRNMDKELNDVCNQIRTDCHMHDNCNDKKLNDICEQIKIDCKIMKEEESPFSSASCFSPIPSENNSISTPESNADNSEITDKKGTPAIPNLSFDKDKQRLIKKMKQMKMREKRKSNIFKNNLTYAESLHRCNTTQVPFLGKTSKSGDKTYNVKKGNWREYLSLNEIVLFLYPGNTQKGWKILEKELLHDPGLAITWKRKTYTSHDTSFNFHFSTKGYRRIKQLLRKYKNINLDDYAMPKITGSYSTSSSINWA